MAEYKTYKKEKWLYFFLAFFACFVPTIITISIFFPIMETHTGVKIGMAIVLIFFNFLVFLINSFASFLVKFPFFNVFALAFLIVGAFFATDFFQYYVDAFMWIALATFVGSVLASIFWAKSRKYSRWQDSIKAVSKSGILGAIK